MFSFKLKIMSGIEKGLHSAVEKRMGLIKKNPGLYGAGPRVAHVSSEEKTTQASPPTKPPSLDSIRGSALTQRFMSNKSSTNYGESLRSKFEALTSPPMVAFGEKNDAETKARGVMGPETLTSAEMLGQKLLVDVERDKINAVNKAIAKKRSRDRMKRLIKLG